MGREEERHASKRRQDTTSGESCVGVRLVVGIEFESNQNVPVAVVPAHRVGDFKTRSRREWDSAERLAGVSSFVDQADIQSSVGSIHFGQSPFQAVVRAFGSLASATGKAQGPRGSLDFEGL